MTAETPKLLVKGSVLYAVLAVIFDEDKILMFDRRGKGSKTGWEPVKGSMHAGETEKYAVLREIKEEAGLTDVKIIGKLPKKMVWEPVHVEDVEENSRKDKKIRVKSGIFVCQYAGGEIKMGEPEHVGFKWMSLEEAAEKIWLPNGKKMLQEAYEFYKRAIP